MAENILNYDTLTAYIDGLYADGSLSAEDYQKIINFIYAEGELSSTARDLIQIRRGMQADLPQLAQGELGFTLDTEELYVGGTAGNVMVSASKNTVPPVRRPVLQYYSSTKYLIRERIFGMYGFRMAGNYYNQKGKIVYLDSFPFVDFITDNLVTYVPNQWYATYIVLDNNTPVIKCMPFFRIDQVVGSTVSFSTLGASTPAPLSYNLTPNQLQNLEALVIKENANFSGRVTSVSSNTADTVTLANIGTMTSGDTFLVAPPYDDYCYLGSFYVDSGPEVFNRGDDGLNVFYRGTRAQTGTILNGDLTDGVTVDLTGYISPLATGALVYVRSVFSTATTGSETVNYAIDPSHAVYTYQGFKTDTTSFAIMYPASYLPFQLGPRVGVFTGGTLAQYGTRELHIRGFSEM